MFSENSIAAIRERALLNILSKLEHGLIEIGDLAYDPDIIVDLLEWFNYSDARYQCEVLSLLLRLAQVQNLAIHAGD
jgi:rotatin